MTELKNQNADTNSSSQLINRQMQRNWLKLLFSVDDLPLLPEQQIKVDEYWNKLSNGKYQVDPIYCKFYTERTGKFDPRYIPDDFQFDYLENRTINFDYVKAFTDKNYIDLLLSGIKTPEAVVRCVNGAYLDKNFKAISKDEALSLLEEAKTDGLIKKPAVDNNVNSDLKCGKDSTKEDLTAMLSFTGGNNFVIRKPVKQHKDMILFSGKTSTCVTVLSVRNTKSVVIISSVACIRDHGITLGNKDIGELYCGIDKLGKFKSPCFNYKGVLMDIDGSGAGLEGREIKAYDRILQTVREYHEKLPQFGVAAWDFMVDENCDPVLIGYHVGKADIHFHQLCNGPLYGEMTDFLVAAAFGGKTTAKKNADQAASTPPADVRIISQPRDAITTVGQIATFSVEAVGSGLSYQWQYKLSTGTKWNNSTVSKAKTAELAVKVTASLNGQQYRCVITDANGNTACSETVCIDVF